MARLFLGLGVPEGVRQRLAAAAQTHFQKYFAKLAPEENWHMTLFFFGNVRNHAQYLGRLQLPLPQAFVPTVSITHIGRGMKRDQLWAYVTPTAGFMALREALDERLRKIHFPRPVAMGKYVPHIRLANFYPVVRSMGIADTPVPAAYSVQEAYLYKSELTPERARYDIEATIPL